MSVFGPNLHCRALQTDEKLEREIGVEKFTMMRGEEISNSQQAFFFQWQSAQLFRQIINRF